MDEDINLHEYIEVIFKNHQVIHQLEKEAVEIAARELARRLEDLNHAHERSIEERSRFVTQEIHKALLDNVSKQFERSDERIGKLENFSARAAGVIAILVLFAGIFGAALSKTIFH